MSWQLTRAAELDLLSIAHYTLHQWGASQLALYQNQIEACLDRIGSGEAIARSVRGHAETLASPCERHLILFREQEQGPAVILAILHQSMDLVRRINERLSDPDAT